jgi:hypothetical protein
MTRLALIALLAALFLCPSTGLGATVEVRAWSDNTWVAWRGIGFAVDRGRWIPARCIGESRWGSKNCADLVASKTDPGWNAGDWRGWVKFKVTGRPTIVALVPCCGNPEVGWKAVSFIEIRVDGAVVHRAFHTYSLDSGFAFEIEIPKRIPR